MGSNGVICAQSSRCDAELFWCNAVFREEKECLILLQNSAYPCLPDVYKRGLYRSGMPSRAAFFVQSDAVVGLLDLL